MQYRDDFVMTKGFKRHVIRGLRSAAPPSEVRVYSATTGQLLRIEPADFYDKNNGSKKKHD